MIIKSLSRKASGSGGTGRLFNYLFRYMTNEEKSRLETGPVDVSAEKKGGWFSKSHLVIKHNVTSRSVKGFAAEFERNEENRIYKRKDAVSVYHTIISFSNKDKAHVTDEVLADTARKYIELRGRDNMYVFTAHHDKDHLHLHCAMSATGLDGMSARISRAEFSGLKQAMTTYQKEKYPELVNSLPRHGRTKEQQQKKEAVKIIKTERTSQKNALLGLLETTIAASSSREDFFARLSASGHEAYYRSGKLTGLWYEGRKFRLARLGYGEEKLSQIGLGKTKTERALNELEQLRSKGRPREAVSVDERLAVMRPEQRIKELDTMVSRSKDFERKQVATDSRPETERETRALDDLKRIREQKNHDRQTRRDDRRDPQKEDDRKHENEDQSKSRDEDRDDKNADRDASKDDRDDEHQR